MPTANGRECQLLGTAYALMQPAVNSPRTYSETIVDNANNTILIGYSETVTAVAADGTISETQQSTTGSSIIVNGTNYAPLTETQTYDGSSGQETGYTYTSASGDAVTCIYDPREGGPDFPLRVGQTWSIEYTFACRLWGPGNVQSDGQRRRCRVGHSSWRNFQRPEVTEHRDVDRPAGNCADRDRDALARRCHLPNRQAN